MKIIIKTIVARSMSQVWEGFNRELFLALSPPFPKVKLQRFDGCMVNDEVHLLLDFIIFKQQWSSLIIAQEATSKQIYFIDKGLQLPFFISKWHHIHRIGYVDNISTCITDEITFSSPLGWIIYPMMYLQFYNRKAIYKKIFR